MGMVTLKRRDVWGFVSYDFANSAYVLIIQSFLFPIVFREVVFSESTNADFYWGAALSFSVLLALLLGPWLGHLADMRNRKAVLSWCIAIPTAGLLFLGTDILQIHSVIFFTVFIIVNAAFTASQIVYDSFLPFIARRGETSTVSGMSWGFGYLGGVLCLMLIQLNHLTDAGVANQAFTLTAFFYFFFSLVSLVLLPRISRPPQATSFRSAIRKANIKKFLVPLLGIWLINEAIDVFIFFGPIFAQSNFELTIFSVGKYILLVQLIGFPATWIFGWLGSRIGIVRTVSITVVIWLVVGLGASLSESRIQILIVAILGALVIGSTQALLRAYYSNVLQLQHAGLSFGFYSIASRSSAVIGPLAFGAISSITGSQRIAIAATAIPFAMGLAMILWFNGKSKVEVLGSDGRETSA